MGRRQQSPGSAWDQPEEPVVVGGQQRQKPVVAFAVAEGISAEVGDQQQQKPAATFAVGGISVAVAEGGPAAGGASLNSH